MINPHNNKAVKRAQRKLSRLLQIHNRAVRKVRRAKFALDKRVRGSINAYNNSHKDDAKE